MSTLTLWWIQALIIAVITSAVLNSALFIPYLRSRKVKRIDARVVGFGGTTVAFFLWCRLNPSLPVWDCGFPAWLIILGTTLGPNWLVHKCRGDDPDNGATKTIQIGLTDKGRILLEKLLKEQAPEKDGLDGLFKKEQRGESVQERWENAMFPSNALPGLLDEIMVCIVQALREEQPAWLLTALADVQEVRQEVCKTRWNLWLWYRMFWPECTS